MVFGGGESGVAGFDPGEVDHPDVLMGGVDAMDVEEAGCDQGPGAWLGGGRSIPDEFHVEPAFLEGFPKCGLLGILVEFDVPAEWKPAVQFTVMNDEDLGVVDDKDGDGEIDFFVDMGHGVVGQRGSAFLGPVFAGAPAGPLLERVGEHEGIGVTDGVGNVLEFKVGSGQQIRGVAHAQVRDLFHR